MDNDKKKPWTKPVLRRLEPTEELLRLFADRARETATPHVKIMK